MQLLKVKGGLLPVEICGLWPQKAVKPYHPRDPALCGVFSTTFCALFEQRLKAFEFMQLSFSQNALLCDLAFWTVFAFFAELISAFI